MKKKLLYSFSVVALLFVCFLSIGASANSAESVAPQGVPDPTYPNSSIPMKPGDVLYSSKSLGSSSPAFGHVGVVGTDLYVYHSNPYAPGARDTIDEYMSRHKSKESITVLRYRYGSGTAPNAAAWAKNNYYRVKTYSIPVPPLNQLMGDVETNYCSKFVWQAFYFGEGKDLHVGLNPNIRGTVTPSEIRSSSSLSLQGSFTVNH